MTFEGVYACLLLIVRQQVSNGDLTERSLAKRIGISQSHMHNVLKGVRVLSNNLAEALLLQLKMSVEDLTGSSQPEFSALRAIPLMTGWLGEDSAEFDPGRTAGSISVPALVTAGLWRPVMARLGRDAEAAPRFEENDLVLIDKAARPLADLQRDAVYVVATEGGTRLRYLRGANERFYMASEASIHSPARWEAVGEDSGKSPVRGIVIWVSRSCGGGQPASLPRTE